MPDITVFLEREHPEMPYTLLGCSSTNFPTYLRGILTVKLSQYIDLQKPVSRHEASQAVGHVLQTWEILPDTVEIEYRG